MRRYVTRKIMISREQGCHIVQIVTVLEEVSVCALIRCKRKSLLSVSRLMIKWMCPAISTVLVNCIVHEDRLMRSSA